MSGFVDEILRGIPQYRRDSAVTDIHLAQIAGELKNWEEVAPYLGLSEAQEEEIRYDFRDRYGLQKREALRKWRQMKGSQATYEQLIVALCSGQNVDLAAKIRGILVGEVEEDPVLETFRRYLIDCCKQTRHPAYEQWPTLNVSSYVDLALVSVSSNTLEIDKEVKLQDVFRDGRKQVVLIEGPPGSGKTTLTWHVSQQWAENKLFREFSLLIPISLASADYTLLNATCLADIIPYPTNDMREQVARVIADREGKGVCFLIDSWDEVPRTAIQQRSYLYQLVKGRLGRNLPHCNIIVTSRPTASSMLHSAATTILRISEFDAFRIEEFVHKNLKAEDAQVKFMHTLDEKPQLYALCHLPLNITIAVYLFSVSSQELPSTRTELYEALVLTQLARHRQLRTEEGGGLIQVSDIDNLPRDMKEKLVAMCKMAYAGLREGCTSFDLQAMKKHLGNVPDMLSIMQTHKQIMALGMRHIYSFLHFTIQEYLAAYSIAGLECGQQKEAVEGLLKIIPLTTTLPFLSGLTKLSNKAILSLLLKVMEQPLDIQSVGRHLVRHVNEPGSDPRRLLLALLNCVFESGETKFYSLIHPQVLRKNLPVQLSFDGLHLSPTDCLSIGCFLRHTTIGRELTPILTVCNISDVGFKMIIRQVIVKRTPRNNTTLNLTFNTNPISHRALECIRGGLGKRKLRIHFTSCWNPQMTRHSNLFTALKYLIEGLSRSSACIGISLGDDRITAKHKYYLVLLILCSKSLKSLTLAQNDLRGAMLLLGTAVNHSSLDFLEVSECCLGNQDLIHLGETLKNNTKVKFLHIRENYFSSDIFTKFLTVLCDSNSLVCNLEYHRPLTEAQRRILAEINYKRWISQQPPIVVKQRNDIVQCSYEWMKNMMSLPPDFVTGKKDSNCQTQ